MQITHKQKIEKKPQKQTFSEEDSVREKYVADRQHSKKRIDKTVGMDYNGFAGKGAYYYG